MSITYLWFKYNIQIVYNFVNKKKMAMLNRKINGLNLIEML